MISILFTNDIPFNPYYGGIERVTDVLTKRLLEKGYNVFYLSTKCPDQNILNYNFPVNQYLLPNKKLYSNENKLFYSNFIQEKGIQIVINQRGLLQEGNFYLTGLPASIKVISCFHSKPFGYWEISKDVLFVNNKSILKKIACLLKFISYPVSLFVLKNVEYRKTKKQIEFAVNSSDKSVFLSESYISIVKERCEVSQSKMSAIPNPNTYISDDIKQVPKEKMILFVGRLTFWDKRPKTVLKIWSEIQDAYPDWSLYIIGHGYLENSLKKYIYKRRLERVHLEGKQNPLSYYQRASVFCMTSAYEGFPMALTEAMQNRVVPLVFNTFGAAADIIKNESDGFLIPAFDLNKFVEKLKLVLSDDQKRVRVGVNAQESVQQFNIENIVSKWELIFNKLVN